MANRQPKARNYLFTINFGREYVYDEYLRGWRVEGEEPRLLDFDEFPSWVTYCTYSLEVGPENGLEHFQGYLECRGQQNMTRIHQIPGMERSALLVRQGTQGQAVAYAQKADTHVDGPWTHGELKEAGKRNDLLQIKEKIDRGLPMVEIADEHFGSYIRMSRGFREYKRIKTRDRDWLTQFYIILGPTRSGKSRLAREMAPTAYWKANTKWWDDYDGQEDVIWDEFRPGACSFTDLLRLLDSTPLTGESKGSTVKLIPKLVIFTTNVHPQYWYNPENVHHTWDDSPLRARIEEYGCIIQTGARRQQPNPEGFPGVYNDESDMMMELALVAEQPEPAHGGQDPAFEMFPPKDKGEADGAQSERPFNHGPIERPPGSPPLKQMKLKIRKITR